MAGKREHLTGLPVVSPITSRRFRLRNAFGTLPLECRAAGELNQPVSRMQTQERTHFVVRNQHQSE